MQLGLCSYAYRWSISVKGFIPSHPMTALQLIQKTVQHGLAGIQICDHVRIADLSDLELLDIRKSLEDNSLFVETGASKSDSDYLRRMIEVSKKIGAKVMRVILEIDHNAMENGKNTKLQQCVDQLYPVIEEARAAGVKLALENHAQITSDELVILVNEINDEFVGVCLDTMNSIVPLEHPLKTAKLLAPYTISAHFKDFEILFDPHGHRILGVPMGDGVVDFKAILKLISSSNHDPNIFIELFVDQKENEEETLKWESACIDKSVKYARNILNI